VEDLLGCYDRRNFGDLMISEVGADRFSTSAWDGTRVTVGRRTDGQTYSSLVIRIKGFHPLINDCNLYANQFMFSCVLMMIKAPTRITVFSKHEPLFMNIRKLPSCLFTIPYQILLVTLKAQNGKCYLSSMGHFSFPKQLV
jgi:hypothetical protein